MFRNAVEYTKQNLIQNTNVAEILAQFLLHEQPKVQNPLYTVHCSRTIQL